MNAHTSRRAMTGVLAVLLLAAALAGLWRSGAALPRTDEERSRAVAAALRCPNCAGQSLAESRSEVAQAMRAQIDAQIAEDRSDEQIRSWFAQRYGEQILLAPPARGDTLLVWLLPIVVVGVGGGAAWSRRRRISAGIPVTGRSVVHDSRPPC